MPEPMTDAQIESWRSVLVGTFGSYALLMPREQVCALRDRIQAQINTAAQEGT